jgi:MFS family permease
MSIFSTAPFMGPALGPVIGGFLGETAGWRWVMGFMAAFSGLLWIIGTLLVPETYAPVLLRKRSEKLSKITGKVYRSKLDIERGQVSISEAFKAALSRPWILLFREPIVLILSIYMAIVYGTLYLMFAAYPIVYQEARDWSEGIGGLPFLAILIGMLFAVAYTILYDNKRYQKTTDRHGGFAPPEARLPAAMIGGVALPIGLFWFAWTNYPTLPWQASVAAGIPFGFGMCLVFLATMVSRLMNLLSISTDAYHYPQNYLIDAYTIFAASVLAANSVLRSCFGAVFPLFTTYMYKNLGIHWASSIPAFLALACVPFPFLFYKYGTAIRERCKFASQSEAFMKQIRGQDRQQSEDGQSTHTEPEEDDVEKDQKSESPTRSGILSEVEGESEAMEYLAIGEPKFERIKTSQSQGQALSYEGNPYDIDRVNTRESFNGSRSRASSSHSTRSRGFSLTRTKSYLSRK